MTSVGICQAGDALGLIDGDVAVIGADLKSVGVEVIDRMLSAGGELVTIVAGAEEIGSPEPLAPHLRTHLREVRPDVEVVTYEGGQEHYRLLLGVE